MSHNVLHRPDLRVHEFHGLYTVAPEMLALFEKVRRVARTDATVLVRGETGTGKEGVARAIHLSSPRARRPFQAVNCATFTSELLSSELFGHVRGSFTGAIRDRVGLLRSAEGGTVFLDEIAEMPLDVQARLLRVLQEKSFVPLGATDPVSVDVRLVSATHRALRHEVEERRFREDLMYRVRVAVLYLPPLRDRQGDVEALTWRFVDELNQLGWRRVHGIARDALEAMVAYPWPGNIRELKNNLEQAFALGEGPVLNLEELAPELRGEAPWGYPDEVPAGPDDGERRRLVAALEQAGGRKAEAAALLGMSRSTLWRKLGMYGIR
jgi:two-component system response regulator AtoC